MKIKVEKEVFLQDGRKKATIFSVAPSYHDKGADDALESLKREVDSYTATINGFQKFEEAGNPYLILIIEGLQ